MSALARSNVSQPVTARSSRCIVSNPCGGGAWEPPCCSISLRPPAHRECPASALRQGHGIIFFPLGLSIADMASRNARLFPTTRLIQIVFSCRSNWADLEPKDLPCTDRDWLRTQTQGAERQLDCLPNTLIGYTQYFFLCVLPDGRALIRRRCGITVEVAVI